MNKPMGKLWANAGMSVKGGKSKRTEVQDHQATIE